MNGLDKVNRWSGRQDLNLRPPHPQCGALHNCAFFKRLLGNNWVTFFGIEHQYRAIISFDFDLISEACKWLVVAFEKEQDVQQAQPINPPPSSLSASQSLRRLTPRSTRNTHRCR